MTMIDTVQAGQPPKLSRDAEKRDLIRKLRSADRAGKLRAFGLVAPLLIFLMLSFLVPIGFLLFKAIDNREISQVLPRTATLLSDWGQDVEQPPPALYAALAEDLRDADSGKIADAARRLNFYDAGLRSMLMKAARAVSDPDADPRSALLEADAEWGQPRVWRKIQQASPGFTTYYFLRAVDLDRDAKGQIVSAEAEIYRDALWRTLAVGLGVTICCLMLGYPLAYLLSSVRDRTARLLMVFVLLPFWTSLLVRTTAWLVLLQGNGVVNSLLQGIGLTDAPLELVHNRIGVFIAMTHILLPFAVLPILAVMKGIPPGYMRAAGSLGAPPWRAFIEIYLPLTMPGVGAGALLVFILSLGYYITPTLLGGAKDQMMSSFIAFFVNQSTNWSMAAALACVLMAIIVILYVLLAVAIGRRKAGV